ncbi:hypothetical protein BCR37DRAFT_219436 [Protomyces lactucae-debilis]|uniref:Uncharacterized protein n=1 Tax=Protomyces lactucae-debilis TaxID=2754530 RepID=A0A1Y2FST9_PROLT|nr:uncharacterized protein BCR37DRAFT_219436 [Protomyces lactucae-debilis]ORY86384.1 hypothetical protein BCR37DRAFT_219436 [Protomyces lactucae-debilis]
MSQQASSSGRKAPTQTTAIATRGVSLTALMRKRAKDQFESVKRGDGPLPIGQPAAKKTSTNAGEPLSARPTSYTVRSGANIAGERVNLQRKPTSQGTETVQPPVRTIRVKASKAQLRPSIPSSDSSATLQSMSPNIPANTGGHAKSSTTSFAGSPVIQRGTPKATHSTPASRPMHSSVASAKTQQITASPVMSAMLRSRIPQATSRSLTQHASSPGLTPGSGKARFANQGAGSPIAGSGIRVKVAPLQQGTPTGVKRATQQPLPGTIKTPTAGSIRVKTTPMSGTSRPIVIKARPQ